MASAMKEQAILAIRHAPPMIIVLRYTAVSMSVFLQYSAVGSTTMLELSMVMSTPPIRVSSQTVTDTLDPL